MSKAIKKIVEEARDNAYTELDLADREIKSLNSVPILRKLWKIIDVLWYTKVVCVKLWHFSFKMICFFIMYQFVTV
jgi:hypothetical protein